MASYVFTCTRCKRPVIIGQGQTVSMLIYTTEKRYIESSSYGGCKEYFGGEKMGSGELCAECEEELNRWLKRQ